MITVLGSINLDLIADCERLPLPGETISGSRFATAAGGKGANQALAVHRAGGEMRLVGAVGSDGFANQALAELQNDGADLKSVTHLDGATGVAMILVDRQGENAIVVIPGANGLVDVDIALAAIAQMHPGDILLLQQEIPAASLHAALDAAKAAGIKTLLNIAPFSAQSEALAHKADIVIANETEFADLFGAQISVDALQATLRQMAKAKNQTIIVTCGADGVFAATQTGILLKAVALAIQPVDSVGAGDTFCGYLAAGLDAGLALNEALAEAAIAGSLACLKPGAQPAIPYAKQVKAAAKPDAEYTTK